MYGQTLILILFLLLNRHAFAQQEDYNTVVTRYILRYKDLAVSEMNTYHIPASITLAQGILESNAGRSPLAVSANNHFGVKCHKEWTGETFRQDDETRNECFRKYTNPEESFRDHSVFLTQRERYKPLFKLDITDYKGWASGLKAAGYATNPNYPQLLIKTIETFNLTRFDHPELLSQRADSVDIKPVKGGLKDISGLKVIAAAQGGRVIYENNGLRMIIAGTDDNLYQISQDLNISVTNLLKYNDLPKATALRAGQFVYLHAKKRKASTMSHKVAKGDSLYSIAQFYGVKMKVLIRRNGLRPGVEPLKGVVLKLR